MHSPQPLSVSPEQRRRDLFQSFLETASEETIGDVMWDIECAMRYAPSGAKHECRVIAMLSVQKGKPQSKRGKPHGYQVLSS
jgi:hypothetical protein